ncbi:Nup85 nucleoporin-domain-containing protein [Suillus fuscotomentosus]|uniref:Nuclear pore complex protein Nup85 n=1 Tax=Suillus fuscotomentosus TaxID=1912939 RepID=A0AAD4E4K0_9AGAM|nr:Nup85 nucleoporin-domain-containing protein [Suillus fuscotomentosus]KAG1899467.1 Nup85 nucleoporin-domain-containing protein [Suillus fuscotomentosus]
MNSIDHHLSLFPPLIQVGHAEQFTQSGKTLLSAQSPLNQSYAVFPSARKDAPSIKASDVEEQPIFFASSETSPSSERRLFIGDTSIIFAALQNLTNTAQSRGQQWLHSQETHNVIRKLTLDYVNFTRECWIHTSSQGSSQFSGDHYRSLYTCLALFAVLYVPEYGYEDAPVGDDLMEWLNVHFIEPSTEEGDHLSGLDRPWEDETFWPYLVRVTLRGLSKAATFFLATLSTHPSDNLRRLAQRLSPLVQSQPHLQSFEAERDFAYASHRWKDKVKALRIELDSVSESDRHDGIENWWDRLSDIVGILEGRNEVIRRVCEDLGADWREISVSWGVFADARLRRQDLPEVASQVLDDMPQDPTNLEDMVHAALFSGDPAKALSHAAQLDPWLAAHMADLMQSLSLIEKDANEDSGLSVRDFYVLGYAQYLHVDPALWRITVAYMFSCGETGVRSADEALMHVPLKLRSVGSITHSQGEQNGADNLKSGDLAGVVKDINATCYEYQREEVRRTICRIAAQTFVQEKEYGLALSYSSSAEDWPGLGRVVDRVLQEYINAGPAQFIRYVAGIAPSLQALRMQSGAQGIFVHRLMFAVRYAEFHQRLGNQDLQDAAWDLVSMLQDGLSPKSWWAVLLCDSQQLLQHDATLLFPYAGACVLLQHLEEVIARTDQGSGDEHLRILVAKLGSGGTTEALHALQGVRLSLAKYFARCTMIGTGGKQTLERKFIAAV